MIVCRYVGEPAPRLFKFGWSSTPSYRRCIHIWKYLYIYTRCTWPELGHVQEGGGEFQRSPPACLSVPQVKISRHGRRRHFLVAVEAVAASRPTQLYFRIGLVLQCCPAQTHAGCSQTSNAWLIQSNSKQQNTLWPPRIYTLELLIAISIAFSRSKQTFARAFTITLLLTCAVSVALNLWSCFIL